MHHVRTEIHNDIGTITMCRSDKLNAFNSQLVAQIIAAFDTMQNNAVRVVILRAEKGAKVWSAGHDIESLDANDTEGWQTGLVALGDAIRNVPVPVIALVEGSVWGFGCEAAFSCDLIVAVPETSFAITPAKLGAPYPVSGLRTIIPRLGPNLAKEMLFCAAPLEASRLYAQGVINHVICSEEIEGFVQEMADRISHLAPLSIAALKQQITGITRTDPLPAKIVLESKERAAKLLGSEDFREGISALKAKRRPKFQGK
ncbi:Enoyl-CoA hydratase [hydrothermal vent metagenome]|uniref:Enoyl-CoA hydratase n=1 Tax=hydrothermal vent metagenome TaxID=652676 RepID=A0A3B0SG91_9ZZZZ